MPFIQEYTTWYGKRVTKTSLENHYLMVYFQFGIVGLVTFIGHYFYMIFYTHKAGNRCTKLKGFKDFSKWNLCTMIAWTLIIMLIAMFATGLFDELRMIYLLFALAIAYSRLSAC